MSDRAEMASASSRSGGDPEGILHALATANPGNFVRLARQFILKWAKFTGLDTTLDSAADSVIHFHSHLPGLYLRGFEAAHCFMVPTYLDTGFSIRTILMSMGRYAIPVDTLPIILCLSDDQHEEAVQSLPQGRAILLAPADVTSVLARDARQAAMVLRSLIVPQVSLLRLQPYDTTQPVSGDMFFGRRIELDQLQHQTHDWFLINGPSRIGKTSLQAHYKYLLRRSLDPRLERQFYVNLLSCARKGPNEIARHFATSFRDNKYTSEELLHTEVRSFLFSVVSTVGGPLEIVLDEADAVCDETNDLLLTISDTKLHN